MLNAILLFVLIYIIISIFVNLMIFYVNDEFKDLNKFNLFYFIIVYIFSSFTLGIYIRKASKFEKNNKEFLANTNLFIGGSTEYREGVNNVLYSKTTHINYFISKHTKNEMLKLIYNEIFINKISFKDFIIKSAHIYKEIYYKMILDVYGKPTLKYRIGIWFKLNGKTIHSYYNLEKMFSQYHSSYYSIKEIFLDFKVDNIFELQEKIEKEFKELNKNEKYIVIDEIYIEMYSKNKILWT